MPRRRPMGKGEVRADVRNLIKISGSHYLSIPPEFVEAHNLEAGDALPIAYNGVLTVTPMPKIMPEEEALVPRKEILLPYPEDIDTSDEGRLSVAAFAKNYQRINEYAKKERPDWEMLEVRMETVVRRGKRFFLVKQIINTTRTV